MEPPSPHHPIIPPYLLEHLACADGQGPVPSVRAPGEARRATGCDARELARIASTARATLLLDQALRHSRQAATDGLPVLPSGTLVRTVSDARNSENLPGALARAEGEPPTGDVDVDRAYDGLGHAHRFLEAIYPRTSLDGAGLHLRGTVHFGIDYENAFWDGEQMVMGDGDGRVFTSFTSSLSVIAHELGHGLLQYTTALRYRGQSGALNESFADVLGVLTEQYTLGQSAAEASWLVGEGLFTGRVNGRGLRSLAAPGTAYDDPLLGRDPQPDHMERFIHTDEDDGGVHLNSGIPNRAFHLAATEIGGPAWVKAGLVWFNVALSGSLPADADFALFSALTVAEAGRLFGVRSRERAAVAGAWAAVGLPVPGHVGTGRSRSGNAPRP